MNGFFKLFTLTLFFVLTSSFSNPQEFTLLSPNADTPIDLVFSAPLQEMNISITPKSLISFDTPHGVVLAYDPAIDTLITTFSMKFGSDIKLEDEPNDIYFLDTEQWKLIYFEDFQGSALGWSEISLSSCGTSPNLFLGGHCNFASQVITKNITNLPPHKMVKIKFNFHFFGNWTGENAYAKIDGEYIWTESYSWCDKVLPWYCKKYGISACNLEFPEILAHPVEYTGKHYSSQLSLSFSTNLNDEPCKASWGIDDIQVYVS